MTAIATVAVTAAASVTAATAVIAAASDVIARAVRRRVTMPRTPRLRSRRPPPGRSNHELCTDPDPTPVLSSPQDLPVLGRQCAENRLQGRAASAALCLRARQDCTKPHNGRVGEEAARTR